MRESIFSSHNIRKVWIAGLIVGSLDIIAAFIDAWLSFKGTPGQILTYIAGATIGFGNAKGGFLIMLLGLLIHFFIAYCYTFLFYFIWSWLSTLFRNALVIGILYGIFIWVTMRFIILPVLSQVRLQPFDFVKAIKPALILIGAIGIPLSFMMNRMNKPE